MTSSSGMIRSAQQSIGRMSAEPARRLAVVSCMDARVDPLRILEAGPGDLHVIRNAGGIVTDDVLRSLLLSQRYLGTRQVLVMMHTDCGVAGLDDERELDAIERDSGDRPGFALGGFSDLEDRIHSSLEQIRGSRFLPHRDRASGAIYDVVTQEVRKLA